MLVLALPRNDVDTLRRVVWAYRACMLFREARHGTIASDPTVSSGCALVRPIATLFLQPGKARCGAIALDGIPWFEGSRRPSVARVVQENASSTCLGLIRRSLRLPFVAHSSALRCARGRLPPSGNAMSLLVSAAGLMAPSPRRFCSAPAAFREATARSSPCAL